MVLRHHSTVFLPLCQEKFVPLVLKSIIQLDICLFISRISCMKQAFVFLALGGVAACVATANDAASMCARLDAGLQAQLRILDSIQDASSASAHVAELAANFAHLKALSESMDVDDAHCKTTELWRYIDSTPDVKPRLVGYVQQISIRFERIEKAEFYGCAELKELLAPLLTPASVRTEMEE